MKFHSLLICIILLLRLLTDFCDYLIYYMKYININNDSNITKHIYIYVMIMIILLLTYLFKGVIDIYITKQAIKYYPTFSCWQVTMARPLHPLNRQHQHQLHQLHRHRLPPRALQRLRCSLKPLQRSERITGAKDLDNFW